MRSRAAEPPVEIGRDIADFLNDGDRRLDRVLDDTGEIALEIGVSGTPEERGRILLDVPWDLPAPNGFFPAADNDRLYRLGRPHDGPFQALHLNCRGDLVSGLLICLRSPEGHKDGVIARAVPSATIPDTAMPRRTS